MMQRPDVRCLVGWPLLDGDVIVKRVPVSLAEAATFHQYGWVVLVDPADLEALAAWERSQRPWNAPRAGCSGD